jgi:hypothetical protein
LERGDYDNRLSEGFSRSYDTKLGHTHFAKENPLRGRWFGLQLRTCLFSEWLTWVFDTLI